MTVLVSTAAPEAVVRLCKKLLEAHAAVRVVSKRPLQLGGHGISSLVAEAEESLWELIPPSSLVICTDPEQEAEVKANTGFPVRMLQNLDQADGEALEALQRSATGRSAFRRPMLSVCMIAKDEEKNIGRALRSVCGVAGEIILVDTGSTDNTMSIARTYGAQIYQMPWSGNFSAARNESLAHATGDWILVLDADEAVSAEFRRSILRRIKTADGVEALSQPLINIVNGREQDRVSVLRLFRNREAYRFEGRVHEQVHPSILRAGGKIGTEPTAIFHYGYSTAESFRKRRRQRNRQLLEAGYREDPERVDYWHHLGHEALIAKDFAEAELWLRKVIAEAPTSPFVALSAPLLARALMGLGKSGEAWDAVNMGLGSPRARGKSLSVLGDLALQEGDFATADWVAAQLQRMPPSAEGYVHADRLAAQLRARSLLERGKRREAIHASERLFRQNPEDTSLAFWYVSMVELAEGLQAATVETIRRYGTAAVKAAAIRPLVHAGEWGLAGQLAETTGSGLLSPYHVVAHLHAGRRKAAVEAAGEMGLEGAVPLVLWGLEQNDADILNAGLTEDLPACYRTLVRYVQEGKVAPESLAWALHWWMEAAVQLRMDGLFARLAELLPGVHQIKAAKAALVLYQRGRKQEGLRLALEAPSEPEALQVIGLAAYDERDWETAATFLTARASLGDAPVQVYWRGAQSWKQLGKAAEARMLLEEGRRGRPHSKMFSTPFQP